MHTSTFLLTLSLFFVLGLVDAKPPARISADLIKRQGDAANGCQNTCTPFLQGAQTCTVASCLCTAANQSNLQACLNCLGSIPDSSLAQTVSQAAQEFNSACAGTATVTAAGAAQSATGGSFGGSFSSDTGDDDFGGASTAGGDFGGFSTDVGTSGAFPTGVAGGGGLTGGGSTTGSTGSGLGGLGSGGGLGSSTGTGQGASNGGSKGGSNSNSPAGNNNTPFSAGKIGGQPSTIKKTGMGVLGAVSLVFPLFF